MPYLLGKCRLITSHFNYSSVAQDELKKIQSRFSLRQLSIVQDLPTRWSSSLPMPERMSKTYNAIWFYASTNTKVKLLTAGDKKILTICVGYLKHLHEVTKAVSSADSCLADAIPLVATMKTVIRNVTRI